MAFCSPKRPAREWEMAQGVFLPLPLLLWSRENELCSFLLPLPQGVSSFDESCATLRFDFALDEEQENSRLEKQLKKQTFRN